MVSLISRKKKGKYKYYYLVISKRVNGKPRIVWQKYLGTAERLKQTLENTQIPDEVDTKEFGAIAALLSVNRQINFVDVINKHIPKRKQGLSVGDHILISLINRIIEPLSKNKLGDWYNTTILKQIYGVKADYLSSQGFWNNYNCFDDKKLEEIQNALLPTILEEAGDSIKDLFYDPTNFTTFIEEHENSKIAKFGHSKSGIKGLRQINLALLITKEHGIPLWHSTYAGNINDVTKFKEFIGSMTDKASVFLKKCKSITLIFDKGNNSKGNISNIGKNLRFYVLGSLKPSEYKELMQLPLAKFNYRYTNEKKEVTLAYSARMEVFGSMKTVVVTYNSKTAYNQRGRTKRALGKALTELRKLRSKLNTTRWSDRDKVLIRVHEIADKKYLRQLISYELVEEEGRIKLNFKLNKERYSEIKNAFGKNILFTDNDSLTTKEVIKAYRDKYLIEDKFRKLKNPHIISFTPPYCWTDKSIKVHAFTCVMALLFISLLKKRVYEAGLNLSDEEIIWNLKQMKQVIIKMPYQREFTKTTKMHNKIEKDLFRILDLAKYE
jgi:transposase